MSETNLVRKTGIPAFAYSKQDTCPPRLLNLKIKRFEGRIVFSLDSSLTSDRDKPLITLLYEGDNIIPNQKSLHRVDISLQPESVSHIERNGNPSLRTLSLTLHAPCSVWYPRSDSNQEASPHTSLQELSALSDATEVHIVLDIKWMRHNDMTWLQSALEGSRQLKGIPISPEFSKLYQKAPKVLPSVENLVAGAPSFEDVVHDAPPSYTYPSNKRSRDSRWSSSRAQHRHIANAHSLARTSLTPDSPLPKRLFQDPTCVPSPTKRATSTVSSTSTVQVDVFQDVVRSEVVKLLPDLLRELFPTLLQDFLPRMLVRASPSPSPSPSLSPTPRPSQITNALTQHRRTPSHNHMAATALNLKAVINSYAETHLQKILTDTLNEASEQASELYNSASVELEDYISETKFDFTTLKDDHIADFDECCNQKLMAFKESLVDEIDGAEIQVKTHAEEVVFKACDNLNMMGNGVSCRCRCKCPCSGEHNHSKLEQGRRVMSLPL